MNTMKNRTFLLLLLSLCCLARPLVADPTEVSLIQLIANPKEYHGKVVRVIGFVRIAFEGNSLYLHEDDYKHGITRNGLWVEVSGAMRDRKAKLDLRYVIVEGTFDAKMKGHMGLWSGSLQDITRCDVWR